MKLNELKRGKKAIIKTVGGKGALRRRLLDLGLTPKTEVMRPSVLSVHCSILALSKPEIPA